MGWDVTREGRGLQRIVALLVALAHVADRTGSLPIPARMIVLAILRHAETVAWSFACQTKLLPPVRGRNRKPQSLIPPVHVAGDFSPAEATRLTHSLRALALIVAHWAMQAVSPPVPRSVYGFRVPACALEDGSRRIAETFAAPDTS